MSFYVYLARNQLVFTVGWSCMYQRLKFFKCPCFCTSCCSGVSPETLLKIESEHCSSYSSNPLLLYKSLTGVIVGYVCLGGGGESVL